MTWFWIFFVVFMIFSLVVFRGSPYVPSQKKYIFEAFTELYKITKNDLLVDIGSGDGIVLRQAAKLGAKAIGFEINPILVLISKMLSAKNKNIDTKLANFWSAKIPDGTTVIYIFSVVRDVNKLTKKLQQEVNRLNHPVKLISYGADFDDFKFIKSINAYKLYKINPIS
jgi:hypothetical protein